MVWQSKKNNFWNIYFFNFRYRIANVNIEQRSDNHLSKESILICQIGLPKDKKRLNHADPSVSRRINQEINRPNIFIQRQRGEAGRSFL